MSLTDLTSLNDSDDTASLRALAELALTATVKPASLCTWFRLIPTAADVLRNSGVSVCVVANFPWGAAEPAVAAAETRSAVAAGAKEVDVVFPYRALLAGDSEVGLHLVGLCREATQGRALLKVILESGQLPADDLRHAAQIAIAGGADFLKTSTGKSQPGATPEAAKILIEAAAAAATHRVGFKASGGIRTLDDAMLYLTLFEDRFGVGSASPHNFRIGASSLFRELIAIAGEN